MLGYGAFAALTAALLHAPGLAHASWPLGLLAAFAALSATLALLRRLPVQPRAPRPRRDLLLRVLATVLLVLTLTGLAGVLGPALSGLVTPFPVATTILVVFAHRESGPGGVLAAYAGYIPSLYSFAAFCAALSFALGRWPLPGAFGFALLVSLLSQTLVLRRGVSRGAPARENGRGPKGLARATPAGLDYPPVPSGPDRSHLRPLLRRSAVPARGRGDRRGAAPGGLRRPLRRPPDLLRPADVEHRLRRRRRRAGPPPPGHLPRHHHGVARPPRVSARSGTTTTTSACASTDEDEQTMAETFELSEFLVDRLGVTDFGARFPHKVGLHASCHGLRELGLGSMSERREGAAPVAGRGAAGQGGRPRAGAPHPHRRVLRLRRHLRRGRGRAVGAHGPRSLRRLRRAPAPSS